MRSISRSAAAASLAVGCLFAVSGLAQTSEELDAPIKAIVSPTPDYGDAVKQYGEMGEVQVYAAVDKAGKVRVLFASGPLAPCADLGWPVAAAIQKAAVEAASKTVLEPPMRNGKPVEVNTYLTYKFGRPAVPPQGSGENRPKMISAGVMNGALRLGPTG